VCACLFVCAVLLYLVAWVFGWLFVVVLGCLCVFIFVVFAMLCVWGCLLFVARCDASVICVALGGGVLL